MNPTRNGFTKYHPSPAPAKPVQPLLFEELRQTVTPDLSGAATIADQFAAFHAANPGVYVALRRLALGLKGRGFRRYGIGGLFEQLRWTYALQTGGDVYKLNNNYRSHYARLLMDENPTLAGFFETRRLQTA